MKPFFDTNILVYAVCNDDPLRQALAQDLLAAHQNRGNVTISTQVLAETYNVLRLRKRWPADAALAAVQLFSTMQVTVPGMETVLRALDLAGRQTLSTWDAMVIQAAIESGCDTLFSEDLQDGRRFGNLQIVNPFRLQLNEPVPAYSVTPVPKATRPPRAARTAAARKKKP